MKENRIEQYASLLIRRDQLKKEAEIMEDEYYREFGDEFYNVYEVKISCIELKKKIHYCQAARNHGEKIDVEMMDAVLKEEMRDYYTQLKNLFANVQGVKKMKVSPEHVVLAVKKKYRELAKMIHPDLHPFTQEDETLMNLWNRAVKAYHMNDENGLDEIRILVRHRLQELGYEEESVVVIEELEEKIRSVNAEIEEIMNTDPYQYKMLFEQEDLVEEKHLELKKELDSYLHYQEELEGILHTFISDGEVTVEWKMD